MASGVIVIVVVFGHKFRRESKGRGGRADDAWGQIASVNIRSKSARVHGRGLVLWQVSWIATSTSPQAADGSAYGYQWWIQADAAPGEVMAQGIYGQYIYINPGLGVVIAVNAADRGVEEPGVADANIAMLRAIALGM